MLNDVGQPATTPPRILLHYPVLNTGGAERSTLRLLSALADRGCEVHLVLTVKGGRLEPRIDPRVIVHHLRDTVGNIPAKVSGLHDLGRWVIGGTKWCWGRGQQVWRSRRFTNMRLDAAICGSAGLSPEFVCRVLDARKRFVFVRSDARKVGDNRWGKNVRKFHQCINGYLCVAKSVRRSMQIQYPEVGDKCVTAYNLLDTDAMRAQADLHPDPFEPGRSVVCVLSVCRLQEVSKGLLRMVQVHRRLLDAGVPHEWHVLGDGPDRGVLEQAIHEQGVSGTFKLHGSIENPFPYYRHADICAVLSRYEGLCGVVNEARVLERPVIATRFAGIEEQIEDGVNGLIVEQDVDAICDGLSSLIRDAGLRERLAQGGYPRALLDDGAKIDALLSLLVPGHATTSSR